MKPVISPLTLQMKRVEVGDLHQALLFLGFTIADDDNSTRRFGASTRSAVRRFQLAHRLPGTGEVDEATAKAINQELANRGALGSDTAPVSESPAPNPHPQGPLPGEFYSVFGRVLRSAGPAVSRAVVRARHRTLRNEVPLGEPVLSDDLGRYAIRYLPPEGVRQVDLVVRATVREPAGETEIAVSDLICKANKREFVDLIAGAEVYRGYSEYERIDRAVQPHLDGAAVGELTVSEVDLLQCKTHENPIDIAYLVIANRYARTEVPAAAYYGFFHMGLPTNLPALVSQPADVHRRALQTALDRNIIPRSLENRIPDILRRLKQIAVKLALEIPEEIKNPSLGLLLTTAGLTPARQAALLTRYSMHEGSIESFWTSLKSDPELGDPVLVQELQFTLQLGTLAAGYVPMVKKLQDRRKAGQIRAVQDLASLGYADWLEMVKDTGTPPGTPGDTGSQKAENYARSLAQTVETAFPTQTIVAGLKRADLPQQEDLLRFFQNCPDFTFETNIDRFLKDRGGTAWEGVSDAEKTIRRLKGMQRIYRVSPQLGRFEAMSTLLGAGLDSAQAIFRQGQDAFVRSFGDPLGGDGKAAEIYEKAAQISALANTVFGRYSLALSVGTPAVIRNPTSRGAEVPDWASLFGSISFCECEHCRSVYSPAAYFVDLLQFVKQQPAVRVAGGVVTYPTVRLPDGTTRPKNALDVLFERRSDLGEIQLSCQNTNTLMPYIDLANEVLENAVVRRDHAFQTTWSSEELAANAEYQNDAAYHHLAMQVYPLSLPFNLWLLEARAYIGHLNSSLVHLMEVLHRPRRTGSALPEIERQIAIESLGLTPVGAQIITGNAGSGLSPWDFWGVESSHWPNSLADLPTFLKQAEMEYTTFEALSRSKFVNPDGTLSVRFKTPCNIDNAVLENLTEPILDRVHRFLRLQHTTGWEISELDAVITAMKASELTMAFLVQTSQIKRLQNDLRTPLMEMLSWWSTISTVVDPSDPEDRSLYDRLFLNNAVLSPADDVFRLNGAGSDLQNSGTAILGEHKPTILSALAVTEADLGLILSDTGKTESDTLTLDLLSQLYRRASLAGALHLSVSDSFSIQKLTGIDPFQNPEASIAFCKEAGYIAGSKFSIADLDYLLRHAYTETSGLAPPESGITLVIDGIKAGLRAVTDDSLRTMRCTQVIVQQLSTALSLETAVCEALLTRYIQTPGDPSKKAVDTFLNIDLDAEAYTASELDTYRLLHKVATILGRLEAAADELVWIFEKGPSLGWLDLNQLPVVGSGGSDVSSAYLGWKRLAALYDFRDRYPSSGDVTVFSLFERVDSGGNRDAVLAELGSLTGWDTAELDELTGPDGFNMAYPLDYGDERYLDDLKAALDLLAGLGVSAATALGWRVFEGLERMKTVAAEIKSTVKARYDLDTWLAVAEPLKNQLRESQRSALVTYLMARRQDIGEVSELFEHYLIDAEMNACMKTSRIKQAISSVQLFVQRGLMNLEPEVEITELSASQWKWMKNYRVWEANRKIFLYPENWILPELRDDKSPFFKELENELLQNEITQETAEAVFTSYLRKLDEVANLDVRAVYHQKEGGDVPIDVLHVVARTHSTPHVYYYRTFVDSASWTPWDKVDMDIEGDHLVAVVWNRRLYLIWPEIEEEQLGEGTCAPVSELFEAEFPRLLKDSNVEEWEELKTGWMDTYYETGLTEQLQSGELDLSEQADWLENFFSTAFPDIDFGDVGSVLKEWVACRTSNNTLCRIQLAWSELKDGTWSAERVGQGSIEILYRDKESFLFKPEIERAGFHMDPWSTRTLPVEPMAIPADSGDLLIRCYSSDGLSKFAHGTFRFTGCGDRVAVDMDDDQAVSLAHLFPLPSSMRYMQLVEGQDEDLPLMLPSSTVDARGNWTQSAPIDYPVVLDKTPGPFVLTVPHQYDEYVSQDDFFYRDERRGFHVVPRKRAPFLTVLTDADSVYFEAALRASPWDPGSVSGKQTGLRSSPSLTPRSGASGKTSRIAFHPKHPKAITAGGWSPIEGILTGKGTFTGGLQIGSSISMEKETVYQFISFFHPHVCTFFEELNAKGIDGLMNRSIQSRSTGFFNSEYLPNADVVAEPYPVLDVDFSSSGAYSHYNWEIFFHLPLLIATRLSQNQLFEEAQQWFHYIFNPMARTDSSAVTGPERYWNFLPFYQDNTIQTMDELMRRLNEGDADLEAQVASWRDNPFNPHLIARMRPVAYQKTVVMKYLDNLIAWGDSLFLMDTIESINEAAQLYVLAAKILGPRPVSLPADTEEDSQTYNSLSEKLDEFSNALVVLENQLPQKKTKFLNPLDGFFPAPPVVFPRPVPFPSAGVETFYFCIPKNDQLCAYWDTVADRLFKIRNCMNIEGVVRELALFEPPINPALLVQAAAAGIDIRSVLSDLYAPPPKYRFQVLIQKAIEFCGEVRSLGAALLAALEKQDAEALALMRAGHEKQLLETMKQTREHQIEEANETLQGLTKAREIALSRQTYYEGLLSAGLISHESINLVHLGLARMFEEKAGDYELRAARNYRIPDVSISVEPTWPPIPQSISTSTGGSFLGNNARARAAKQRNFSSNESFAANRASLMGGYTRREQEWEHQADEAAKEVAHLDKQIAAAQIRLAIAEQELAAHKKQIEHAQEVEDFMTNKFTNEQLFVWMSSQISGIYFQSYQMACDLAKRAEKAYQQELGVDTSSFVTFGHWDSLKKGLLSGEKLAYDLRRMEASYLDENKREYEITKHVSLAMLDPEALLRLTTEGACVFSVPEAVFDLDFPGQYMRRIKSVSMTIPCVTGPYTSVGCTLTLTGDRTRKVTGTGEGYAWTGLEDPRFQHNVIAESISTSSGNNDGGVFVLNFNDERFLPFEGRGAISDWMVKLTSAVPTFPWSSIADVVLHISYTSREGGDLLRQAAIGTPEDSDGGLWSRLSLRRGFSAKHEFSTEWAGFMHPAPGAVEAVLKLDLSVNRFPYFAQHSGLKISDLKLVARVKGPAEGTDIGSVKIVGDNRSETEVTLVSSEVLYAGHPSASVFFAGGADPGQWTVTVPTTHLGEPSAWIDDIVVIAAYEIRFPG